MPLHSFPSIPTDTGIITLSPLPLEIQGMIFHLLRYRAPIKMIRVSKKLYEELIPGIYHTLVIDNDNFKDVFEGLLDDICKWNTRGRKRQALTYVRDLTFAGERVAQALLGLAYKWNLYQTEPVDPITNHCFPIFPKLEHLRLESSVFRRESPEMKNDNLGQDSQEHDDQLEEGRNTWTRAAKLADGLAQHLPATNICLQINRDDGDGDNGHAENAEESNDNRTRPGFTERVELYLHAAHCPRIIQSPNFTLELVDIDYPELIDWWTTTSDHYPPNALRLGYLPQEGLVYFITDHYGDVVYSHANVNELSYYVDFTEDLNQAVKNELIGRGFTTD